jgi:RNA polymerase sigma-70 factor (ECF subfamily)
LDSELINRAIRREKGAIETLYDTHAPRLLHVSFRYCGNREDAEDVLHDGFIKIIQHIDRFRIRESGTLEAWMKRIIVNTALNFVRDRLRDLKNIIPDPNFEQINSTQEDAEDFFEPFNMLDKSVILQMICELPVGYRTVFNLYVFEEYGHKEIAATLGISENTSKSQLSKARAMLRKKITQVIPAEISMSHE